MVLAGLGSGSKVVVVLAGLESRPKEGWWLSGFAGWWGGELLLLRWVILGGEVGKKVDWSGRFGCHSGKGVC